MEVYVELALAENFCIDFVLLYSAKLITKNTATIFRAAVSAALGACFAVAFPLFNISGGWAVAIKIAFGALMCLICGRFKSFKGYIKFSAAFALFIAVLGGGIIAAFSLGGWSYSSGAGYIISSVPIGLPIFCAFLLVLIVRKTARKITLKLTKNTVSLRIFAGQSCVEVQGFYDSGNKVYHLGAPVSVLPQSAAKKLVNIERIKSCVYIHTVAGSKRMTVFTADKVEVNDGKITRVLHNVKFGVSPDRIRVAVLHPDLSEDN